MPVAWQPSYNPGPTFTPSSPFGPRNLVLPGASKSHQGQDFAASTGTDVPVAWSGTVVHVANEGATKGFGKYIVVEQTEKSGRSCQ